VAQARADLSIADAQLHRIHLVAPAAIYMPFYMTRGPNVSNSYAVRIYLDENITNS
jgi:hypothetical protein